MGTAQNTRRPRTPQEPTSITATNAAPFLFPLGLGARARGSFLTFGDLSEAEDGGDGDGKRGECELHRRDE